MPCDSRDTLSFRYPDMDKEIKESFRPDVQAHPRPHLAAHLQLRHRLLPGRRQRLHRRHRRAIPQELDQNHPCGARGSRRRRPLPAARKPAMNPAGGARTALSARTGDAGKGSPIRAAQLHVTPRTVDNRMKRGFLATSQGGSGELTKLRTPSRWFMVAADTRCDLPNPNSPPRATHPPANALACHTRWQTPTAEKE